MQPMHTKGDKTNQLVTNFKINSATIPTTQTDQNLLQRAVENPQFRSPEVILQLQQTYGNRVVRRLLTQRSSVTNKPVVQRWIDPNTVTTKNSITELKNLWLTLKDDLNANFNPKIKGLNSKEHPKINEIRKRIMPLIQSIPNLVTPTATDVPAAKEALNNLALDMNRLERELEEVEDEQKNNHTHSTMKFGTEFTFTNETLSAVEIEDLNSTAGQAALSLIGDWKAEVENLRPKPEISTPPNKKAGANAVQFTYHIGGSDLETWWWALDVDDGCLETQTQPMTQQQTNIATVTNIINNHIFKVATEKLGLQTHDLVGGGHLSIDRASTVGNSARAVRNYLVNYVNDAATWAKYDPDFVNAAMVNELPMENRRSFIALIQDFDASYNNPAIQTMSMDTLLNRLKTQIFTFAWTTKQEGVTDHYQAINLEHMNDEDTDKQRLEMRRFKAQKNFGELVTQMQALATLVDKSRERGLKPLNEEALLAAPDNATGRVPLNTDRLKELSGRNQKKLKGKEKNELEGLQTQKSELDNLVKANLEKI